MRRLWILLLLVLWAGIVIPTRAIECEFKNPLLPVGADPSVVYHDGYYYLVQSSGGAILITKSETITGLGREQGVAVYTPQTGQAFSHDIWAPELVYYEDKWYIYFAATNAPGNNASHRTFVIEADDPLGTWTMRGKVYDPEADNWAIDAVPFEYNDQLYLVWSGWPTDQGDFPQNLYIAEMSDPVTLSSERYLLSEPDQPWERSAAAIQEGPQPFIYDDQLTIVYSADASWKPAYKLGMLIFEGDNPLEDEDWTKVGPVFDQEGDVYGPGHNSSPVPSPDGSEWWLIYHAKASSADGWGDRGIRVQPFEWTEEDLPVFGDPVPISETLDIPSGEPCGLITTSNGTPYVLEEERTFAGDFLDTGDSLINTLGSFTVEAWVKVDEVNPEATYSFVSQEGGISSHFTLQYTEGKFGFTLYNSLGRNSASAVSTLTPEAGQWYHLVGVRDITDGSLTLYVDGEQQGSATFTEDWAALGNTFIGAAKHAVKRADLLYGSVRGVRLYTGTLTAEDIAALAKE